MDENSVSRNWRIEVLEEIILLESSNLFMQMTDGK